MKAWQVLRHGGNEVLKRVEIPTPKPGPGEALIRVEAAGLNHLDLWLRKGVEGHTFHLPMIPGGDITGVIEEMGVGASRASGGAGAATAGHTSNAGVSATAAHAVSAGAGAAFKVGTPVIVNPGISCGICEACLTGFDPLCKHYGIFGETRDGGCADYVVVPFANLVARPAQISAVEGASLSIPYLTAWTMLTRKAQLRPGETILIHAGGSGVSVAAIQMAKLLGATVITTVGTDEKAAKAKRLGADFVINYKKGPFREELKKILISLGKKGCEVVMDHVGADTFNESIKSLAWGGRLVTCGATSGGAVKIDLKQVFFKNISILGSTMGSKGDFIRVVQLVAEGKLKPVIDRTLPMDKLPEAMDALEHRQAFGKVVLEN